MTHAASRQAAIFMQQTTKSMFEPQEAAEREEILWHFFHQQLACYRPL